MPGGITKVSVLLEADEAKRFDAYCKEKGFKKSPLIVRLVREHLDKEQFQVQKTLFENSAPKSDPTRS